MTSAVIAAVAAQAAAVLAVAVAADAAGRPQVGRMTSAALGEVREYTVYAPATYAREPRRRFPVVYVLDGPPLDVQTADAAAANARAGVSPELIVVGIPNMQRGARARDFLPPFMRFARRDGTAFTGQADRFLRFLRDELIARIEHDYRTSGPRMISGHSLGGIFVCYSLTMAPALFDARFIHSPAVWRDEDLVVSSVADWLGTATGVSGYVHLTVGDGEGASLQSGFHGLRRVFERQAARAGLRWGARITPGAVHDTNVALATPGALRAFFTRP